MTSRTPRAPGERGHASAHLAEAEGRSTGRTPKTPPQEGDVLDLETSLARELGRYRLVRAVDHWRLFRDDERIGGPWRDAEVDQAQTALGIAQAKAVLALARSAQGEVHREARERVRRVVSAMDTHVLHFALRAVYGPAEVHRRFVDDLATMIATPHAPTPSEREKVLEAALKDLRDYPAAYGRRASEVASAALSTPSEEVKS